MGKESRGEPGTREPEKEERGVGREGRIDGKKNQKNYSSFSYSWDFSPLFFLFDFI